MKKLGFLLLCLSFLLSGCQSTSSQNDTVPENYAVGVICTTGSKDSSDILYFDTNLDQVGSTHYKYATMGQLFYSPVVYDGSLYVVPQGQANKKDAKTILQQNLTTFEQKEYFLDQIALYGISVDSSAIYVANNLNGQSFISRIDRTDGSVKTATFDGVFISVVYSYNGVLYAFSDQNRNDQRTSRMYCLAPETLEIVSATDISALGSAVYSVTGVEDTLYFVPVETSSGKSNHIVVSYHIPTGEINSIDFGQIAYHILNIEENLYVTHGDLPTGEGTELSIYQLDSEEISTYDLGMWPGQIAVYNDSLYVMGHNQLGKYDLQTLEKQAEVSISLETGYYLSAIFPYSSDDAGGSETASGEQQDDLVLQAASVSVSEAGGGDTFALTGEDAETISQILDAGSWVPDATNCDSDYVVTFNSRTIYYGSDCGTFNERLEQSNQSLHLSETERETVNTIIKAVIPHDLPSYAPVE